jgi:hypothetical protein
MSTTRPNSPLEPAKMTVPGAVLKTGDLNGA